MDLNVSDELAQSGAIRFRGALVSCMTELEMALASVSQENAGARLHGILPLQEMLATDGAIGTIPGQFLGPLAKPVRAILFNKSAETNWSLAWHQDRTICVKGRRDVEGFGPWTVKQGLLHVAPPVELLAKMMTIRVHLDDVPETNAPLMFAPGSHREGMVPIGEIEKVVARYGVEMCLAEAGDIWLYSTLILHASDAAKDPKSRRVLQVDYAAFDLPGGLEWQGV
ncbi:phytanoyl-CoA dioxygenase family protein [Novosphingobium profundi]|nr:phytanoyl-CoA dioxygenase family protein [Novosphingobium profundi]